MDARETELRAVDASGHGLRVVFTFEHDRWRHRIDQVDGEQVTTVWQSVEGTAQDDWPASPALQDLSRETLPDGRQVIFLVGKAGSSHWSASIEAVSEPPQLVFDIACRHGATPGYLGSRYVATTSAAAIAFAQSDLASTEFRQQADGMTITPALVASSKPLQTTRWKYVVG